MRNAPVSAPVQEGSRHWGIFERLCLKAGARGNLVPDAYFAALSEYHDRQSGRVIDSTASEAADG